MDDLAPTELAFTQELAAEVAQATVVAHPDVVEAWQAGTPKTWGHLAGRAVGAARRRAGRPLTDAERRLVWAVLWETLQALPKMRGN